MKILILTALLLGATSQAQAGDHGASRGPILPKYLQECAACHVPYPAGLLPAASWNRLMNNLPQHFGTDASLDPDSVRQISTWLNANAATTRRVPAPPPEDRITKSAWFVREHDEVPAHVWKLPSVRSASNCAACHTTANQGVFNEHAIRIPRQ